MADTFQIQVPAITMRILPDEEAEASNQLLYGETLTVLEQKGEWVHVRAAHDGYEGFIPMSVFGSVNKTPHKISTPITHIYQEPDCKSPLFSPLYMGSHIPTSDKVQNGFRELKHSGWVFEEHLALTDTNQSDFVETALMFIDAPYLWGGRTAAGIDCSGLVQISLMAAGIECPRDTSDQIDAVGQAVEFGDTIQYAQLQRGDLVYFKGHAGIMLDSENILNATARHMRVVIETLDDVISGYDGILAVRRV